MLANLRNFATSSSSSTSMHSRANCRQAQLPDYSFIEPRYFTALGNAANDSASRPRGCCPGEQLIADVYNALSASPLWKQSLLVIVWDEHGGFLRSRNPAGGRESRRKKCHRNSISRTLGLRCRPSWCHRGSYPQTIDSAPYDHSSVPANPEGKLFGLRDFLTARDRAANTFERVCALDAPRADIPSVTPGRFESRARADDDGAAGDCRQPAAVGSSSQFGRANRTRSTPRRRRRRH